MRVLYHGNMDGTGSQHATLQEPDFVLRDGHDGHSGGTHPENRQDLARSFIAWGRSNLVAERWTNAQWFFVFVAKLHSILSLAFPMSIALQSHKNGVSLFSDVHRIPDVLFASCMCFFFAKPREIKHALLEKNPLYTKFSQLQTSIFRGFPASRSEPQ